MYTIARLKGLIELDDKKITVKEREQANSLYSLPENRIRRNQTEDERIRQLEEARRDIKLKQQAKVIIECFFLKRKIEEEKRQRDETIHKYKMEQDQKKKIAQILPSLKELDMKVEKKEVLPPRIAAKELDNRDSDSDSDSDDEEDPMVKNVQE